MVFIIDGDNSPGSKTKDVGLLRDNDELYIVYAANNNFYSKAENRNKIEHKATSKINWVKVPAGNCSADIATAMELEHMLSGKDDILYCLISDDKHFDLIASIARQMHQDSFVACESTITEAVFKYRLLEQTTLREIQECFVNMFGLKHGNSFYNLLQSLILQNTQLNRTSFIQKKKTMLHIAWTKIKNARAGQLTLDE